MLDTAYATWVDVPLSRVQLIIGLDYPRWLSLGRLVRRTFARLVDKRPICNGNVETWRLAVSRDSILMWHFRSFSRKRQRLRAWAAAAQTDARGPRVLRFRTPRDLDRWMRAIEAEQPRSWTS